MTRPKVRFHPEAARELERAFDWYASRSAVASEAFVLEFESSLESILAMPETWPRYLENYRKRVLPRFPFTIVYRLSGDVVEIIAVSHHKKRPGYWRSR